VQWIEQRLINPSFVITHRLSLEDAAHGYEKMFGKKQDQGVKVVLKP
jgi:S-(hydroxymethyl)glutathione dehydrogenase/alcohol dehydrogenase